jgi:hypothetical protein
VQPLAVHHVSVSVPDAAVAELQARGLDVDGPVPVGVGRQAFVANPAGNTVELYEGPAGP